MEVVVIKDKQINISESDFDIMQNAWGILDTREVGDAVDDLQSFVNTNLDVELSKKYSKAIIKAAFELHAEYNGIDKENELKKFSKKNKVDIAKKNLIAFVEEKKPLSIKQAQNILAAIRSLESKVEFGL